MIPVPYPLPTPVSHAPPAHHTETKRSERGWGKYFAYLAFSSQLVRFADLFPNGEHIPDLHLRGEGGDRGGTGVGGTATPLEELLQEEAGLVQRHGPRGQPGALGARASRGTSRGGDGRSGDQKKADLKVINVDMILYKIILYYFYHSY